MKFTDISSNLLIIIVLLLSACQSNGNNESNIRIEIKPAEAKLLQLDEWFQRIELVALETTPESIIAENNKVIFHGYRYYVLDRRQNAIFVFDQKGNFIFNTKSLAGRGPGEYNSIIDFNINETKEQLEILDPPARKIMIYSLNGEYIDYINIKELISPSKFNAVSCDIYAFYSRPKQEDEGRLALYSLSKEEIIKTLAPLPKTLQQLAHPSTRPFIKYCGMTMFKHTVPSNKVFLIDSGSLVLKEYIEVDFGKFNFSATDLPKGKERRFYTSYIESHSNKYAFPIETVELKDYIYHFFFFNKMIFIAKYDKSMDQTTVRYSEFGNPEQLLPTTYSTDSILFNIYSPITIRYFITESLLDEKSLEILTSIKESDNPLIVKYTPIE